MGVHAGVARVYSVIVATTFGDTTDVLFHRDPRRPARVSVNVARTVAHHLPRRAMLSFDFGPEADERRLLELALNVLNAFVPPGADGLSPVRLRSNAASRTAFDLHERFAREFLLPMDGTGASIDGAVVRAWIRAALGGEDRPELPGPRWVPLDPSGRRPAASGEGDDPRIALTPAEPCPDAGELGAELRRLEEGGATYDLYSVRLGDEEHGYALYDHDRGLVGADRGTGEFEWEEIFGDVESTVEKLIG